MIDHWVRKLIGDGAPLHEVGGKAAGLDRLLGNEFRVPKSMVVTTDAYLAFVEHAGLREYLDRLRFADVPPPELIEAETARIDATFLEAPMPVAIEGSIRKAANELFAGQSMLAVRSSASAEDMASASFAGQYRTYLQVGSEEAVLDAVRMCWASLWEPSVRAYRLNDGTDESDLSMAVVLQIMVDAASAGVMFTRDPLGDAGNARVEAVKGLGDSLVSGAATPSVHRVNRATLEVRGSDGEQLAFVEDLVRMGLRVERRFGSPQDIEWAYDGQNILLLQTRPITHSDPHRADDDGFDTPPEGGHTYTPYGLAEMLPGAIPPLLWSINAPMLDNAFRKLFSDLEIPLPHVEGAFMALGRFRARGALNLTVVREAAARIPGGSAAEVERQYLGRVITDEPEDDKPGGNIFQRSGAGLRAVKVRRRVQDEVELLVDATNFTMALGVDLGSLSTSRLLRYGARVRDLAWRGYESEVAASAGAAAAYRALELTLESWVDAETAPVWAQRLTAGPDMADQAGANCAGELWSLYTSGVAARPAYESVLDGPPGEAQQRLEQLGPQGRTFVEAVRRTTRHFGSMAMYGDQTWDEDPSFVWDCIASMANSGSDAPDFSPMRRAEVMRETREEAFDELLSLLRGSWRWRLTRVITGQIVDVRRRLLSKLAGDAALFVQLRERAKSALLILGGEEHRIIYESARRLQASGHLVGTADVLMLSDVELSDMLLGGDMVASEELVRRREAFEATRSGEPLPDTFEGHPGVEIFAPADGPTVEGWPASAGTVRGRARVLTSLADGAALVPGEIIVAPSTDPSWTPLFLIAGGIILEKGGPLSHAAIVARELGLPAVLNVRGATRIFTDGEAVEVDGTAGVVTTMGEDST